MLNQTGHRITRIAPAIILTITLVAFLLFLTSGNALGQTQTEATATPTAETPTPTPVADSEEPTETTVREDCIEDDATGKLTCTTVTVPVSGSEGGVVGSGGGGRVPTLTVARFATSLDKRRSTLVKLAGVTLLTDKSYKLHVKRPIGNRALGFSSNCGTSESTYVVPSGDRSAKYTWTLYGCKAGRGVVTAQLLEDNIVIGEQTQTVSIIGEPGTASTPSVSGKANGRLEIRWRAPSSDGGSRITGYKVRYWSSSSTSSTEVSASANDRTETISGLTNGVSYRAQVRACNRIGCGGWSSSAAGTPYTTPGKVKSLSIDEEGNRSLEVEWDEPDDDGGSDITGYKVQYSEDGSSSWSTALSTSSERRTITGLDNGSRYEVQVQACNRAGCGSWSNSVTGTPHTTPREVEDLTIDEEGDESLEVEWNEPDNDGGSDITGYKVQYSEDGSSSWSTALSAGSERKTITGLDNGSSYEVQVKACNRAGCGSWSSSVRGTPHTTPSEVEDLSIDEEGDETLEVEWDEPDDDGGSDITKYEVQYKRTNRSSWSTTLPTSSERKTITGLDNGSRYEVQVKACNRAGCGSWSSSVRGTPSSPQGPEFDDNSDPDTYAFSVQENAAINTVVGNVSATGSGTLSYSITAGNSANKFSMNSATGQITLSGGLDYESTSSYTLTAQVSDGSGGTDTATVTITVTNVDESPSFASEIYEGSVSESASLNTQVLRVSATDPERDSLSYSIVGGNGAGRFSISSSGKISLAKKLDFEVSTAYELTVKAEDSNDSDKYGLTLVQVTVADVNESPQFDLSTYGFAIRVKPSITSGGDDVLVGGIRAYDPDILDRVSYTITSGDTSNDFYIDGLGRIWARPGGQDAAKTYTLGVRASDGNSGTSDATATVKVEVTSKPIATLKVKYDRVQSVDSDSTTQLDVAIDIDSPSSTLPSNFTLSIADSADATFRGVLGAAPTPPENYRFGSYSVQARSYSNGREYNFAISQSSSNISAALPIPKTAIPTSLSTGTSYLQLKRQGTAGADVAISNQQVPLGIYEDSIDIGESYVSEWGIIPSMTNSSEPNERRFSLRIPSSVGDKKTQIELTSGRRDPILVLEDSSGNVVEWNDDGGFGTNAKIVRQLSSGTYTIVAFTMMAGGQGSFELSVNYTDDDITDPDDEHTDVTEADFYVERPSTSSSQTGLLPSGSSITSARWATLSSSGSCGSSDVSTTTQGTPVCLEVTGSGFEEGDVLLATLSVKGDDGITSVPVTGIGLKYVNSTTMRGAWVAQNLLGYRDDNNRTQYQVSVVGHAGDLSAPLGVGTRLAGVVGSGGSDPLQDLKNLLTRLGVDDVDEAIGTLKGIYGEGYSDAAFAREFLDGALYGEWGVRNDNHGRGLPYFAGWMITGFIPVVDILPDLRDALALEVTRCNGIGWNAWKCRGAGLLSDAVDVVAVVPVWGKLGDVPQLGKAAMRLAGNPSAFAKAKYFPTVVKNILNGRYGCWARPPLGKVGRGRCIQDDLISGLGSRYKNLDEVKDNMPRVDYLDTMPGSIRKSDNSVQTVWTVTSVKSIELRNDTYTKSSGAAIVSTINRARRDLTNTSKYSDKKLVMAIEGRGFDKIDLDAGDKLQRNLTVVIPQNVSATGAQGLKLIEAYCKVSYVNNTLGVVMDIQYGLGQGPEFSKWPGIYDSSGNGLSESECRSRRHIN